MTGTRPLLIPGPAPLQSPVVRDEVFLVVVPVPLEAQNLALGVDVDEVFLEPRIDRHIAGPSFLSRDEERSSKNNGKGQPAGQRRAAAQRPKHAVNSSVRRGDRVETKAGRQIQASHWWISMG